MGGRIGAKMNQRRWLVWMATITAGGFVISLVEPPAARLVCAVVLAAMVLEHWRRPAQPDKGGGADDLAAANSRLEAALADTEQFLNCVPSILIGLDSAGCITRWNPAATNMLGVNAEDAVGRTLDECGMQWSHPRMKSEITRWLQAAAPSYRCHDISFRKDG